MLKHRCAVLWASGLVRVTPAAQHAQVLCPEVARRPPPAGPAVAQVSSHAPTFGHADACAGRGLAPWMRWGADAGGGARLSWLVPGTCRGMAMTATARRKKELARTVLQGELRQPGAEFGKHESRVLRQQGWVPGRIQTRTGDVLGVKFEYNGIKNIAFDRYLKNTVFTVQLKDHEPMRCLIREMQVDPVDDDDLTHVNMLKFEPEHEQKVRLPACSHSPALNLHPRHQLTCGAGHRRNPLQGYQHGQVPWREEGRHAECGHAQGDTHTHTHTHTHTCAHARLTRGCCMAMKLIPFAVSSARGWFYL